MSKLDYKRMLKEIDSLVDNDWAFDIEFLTLPNARPFTQEEALEMANVLGQVYLIAHCIHCKACQNKYLKTEKANV